MFILLLCVDLLILTLHFPLNFAFCSAISMCSTMFSFCLTFSANVLRTYLFLSDLLDLFEVSVYSVIASSSTFVVAFSETTTASFDFSLSF